ncbi:MAG: zinc-ribbon domain-containing protein [Thermodesulfobacteriota bacterium]
MEITCSSCQRKFKIADDKIPPGRTVNISCPKCKNKITVEGPPAVEAEEAEQEQPVDAAPAGREDGFDFDYDYSDKYEATEGAFDFAEEEGKTALICETDPAIIQPIERVLEFMEYHISKTDSAREAIKKMRYQNYHLLIVNEAFDSRNPDANGILIYLSRLHMSLRRQIFVAMLTRRFRTMDYMVALNKSVNLVINTENISQFENILKRSLSDYDIFYRIFHETRKTLGIA